MGSNQGKLSVKLILNDVLLFYVAELYVFIVCFYLVFIQKWDFIFNFTQKLNLHV